MSKNFLTLLVFLPLMALSQQKGSILQVQRSLAAEASALFMNAVTERDSVILIRITGGGERALLEHSLSQEAAFRNVKLVTDAGKKRASAILDVVILNDHSFFDILENEEFLRTVRLDADAKITDVVSQEVKHAGRFQKSVSDTIDGSMKQSDFDALEGAKETWTDALLTPFVVVASSVLIIYLLFSVRSK